MRTPRRLAIRLPGFASPEQSQAWVDGQPVSVQWEGRYVLFPGLSAGQQVALSYPLPQSRRTYHVAGKDYTADWLGNVVVEISPPGTHHPTYRRRPHLDTSMQTDAADHWQEVVAPILW